MYEVNNYAGDICSEIKKCGAHADVVNLRFTWVINNFRENGEKYGWIVSDYRYSADTNKQPSWILCLKRSENYYGMYLKMLWDPHAQVIGSMKLSLLNDRDELLKTHIEPTQEFKGYTTICIENFIDRTILDNLSSNSVVRISCEINYMINKLDFANETKNLKSNGGHEDTERKEFCKNIEELFECKKCSDVNFLINGRLFRAHKSILAAKSDVFAKIFEQANNEIETDCISIYNIKGLVFDEMLHYIYTGTTIRLEKMPMDLLIAAHNYALHDLKSMCEQELKSKLSCKNALKILMLADQYKAVMLKSEAINFINKHSAVIVKSLQWQRIQISHPHLIVELYEQVPAQSNINKIASTIKNINNCISNIICKVHNYFNDS